MNEHEFQTKLAELMGGRVGVESELGEGSVFWLELTLQKASASPATAQPGPVPPRLHAAHVLLAVPFALTSATGPL